MTATAIQLRDAQTASQHEGVLVQAWGRRRPTWTRTDTARWLDDRSEPVVAWLRRHAARSPQRFCRQIGHYLKDRDPQRFQRAHTRLLQADAAGREQIALEEVLR